MSSWGNNSENNEEEHYLDILKVDDPKCAVDANGADGLLSARLCHSEYRSGTNIAFLTCKSWLSITVPLRLFARTLRMAPLADDKNHCTCMMNAARNKHAGVKLPPIAPCLPRGRTDSSKSVACRAIRVQKNKTTYKASLRSLGHRNDAERRHVGISMDKHRLNTCDQPRVVMNGRISAYMIW